MGTTEIKTDVERVNLLSEEVYESELQKLMQRPDVDKGRILRQGLTQQAAKRPALQRLREKIAKQLADESRKICAGALQKVLVKVAFRNPGLNLTNVLRTLPPDADLEALKTLVAPIVDKVSGIKRVEGDRVD